MSRTLALVCALVSAGSVLGGEVYRSDFEQKEKEGSPWSVDRREATPKTKTTFLGSFRNETVSLTLKDLPKHRYLRISVDLYLIRNWPGDTGSGPSAWKLAVRGGPELLNSTFSNWPDVAAQTQSFPLNQSLTATRGGTGAVAVNTLGYTITNTHGDYGPRDSVYKLSFVIPHQEKSVQFDFTGRGLSNGKPDTEKGAWGLDNVVVETLDQRPVVKLTDREMADAWAALTDTDPQKVYKAIGWLIDAEDQAVTFLASKCPEPPSAEKIAALIKQLDSDTFKDREAATRALIDAGPGIRGTLQTVLKNKPSAEVAKRIERILEVIEPQSEATRRAHIRHLLPLIGTDEAHKLLSRLGNSTEKD